MQQISAVLGYALNLIGAGKDIVMFWFDLDECVRAVFTNTEAKDVPTVREKFITTLKTGKKVFPEAETRSPQNLHNVLEFLEVDMEIWVSAYLISGTKEEHKHQVFKGGVAFTNGVDPEGQLIERDRIISGLRFLLHGGTFNGLGISKEFREFAHPSNPHAPHPLLLSLTKYGGKEEHREKPFPRKFEYVNKRQVVGALTESLAKEVAPFVQVEVGEKCVPSKQVVIHDQVFAVGDSVIAEDGDR